MTWQDPGESLTGIGFVSRPSNHDANETSMQRHRPQDSRSYQRPIPEHPSFVRAYSVDPTYPFQPSHSRVPLAPPPPGSIPPLPSILPTSQVPNTSSTPSLQPWNLQQDISNTDTSTSLPSKTLGEASLLNTSEMIQASIPPFPKHPSDYSRPFYSSFSHYGTVALQRQEAQLLTPASDSTSTQPLGMSGEPFSAEVQLARDRAMKIIQQFKASDPTRVDSDIAQKRRACLEQLEKRKSLAMIKNLEYVAKAEDERLKEKLLQVHQTQEYHSKLEARHEQSLQLRLQHLGKRPLTPSTTTATAMTPLLSTQAGIGTQQRQRVEEKRRKTHLAATTLSRETVAIYVSQLPTNGSANEDLLRALFGSLGYSLRKVHFYTNKETGELKGDALIVYELPPNEDRNTLTANVCSQLNGAELPCGTTIKVEASDPLYKLRKSKDADNRNTPVEPVIPDPPAEKDEEEDLDDFFASLDGDGDADDGMT